MAFNSAHVFFTLGFLLLMASGGVEALHWFCNIPSGSFHGPCMSNDHCLAACKSEYYNGDKSKPFTGGQCSLSGSILPRCICSIFCGPPMAEHDDPETHRHHHPPLPPPSEGPELSPPHHHAPPPRHHH
ncbi:uncharacterized protein LOC112271069 [Brachypodium distachyon]|uniref:Knottins-like domain-containing protein n=1 Tax=Brachypodium distachyon TaxID=15368 RepID=I1HUW4_BRADI|nr:uncharacterized protein LOC112271069 [Brachypodium distachyon]KQK11373.1 hypothetical protein BRADI_2g59780v3 [Brachypodium distachyon]|eukprot:XP_024315745.1 uncharacterized protein LOC112271069 [Brachypodium distachyon]